LASTALAASGARTIAVAANAIRRRNRDMEIGSTG
jgi:hypothetical protein